MIEKIAPPLPLVTLPRAFIALAFTFGLAMLIITPPFQVPDEPHHLMRAYQISTGQLRATFRNSRGGGQIPASLLNFEASFQVYRARRDLLSYSSIARANQIPLNPQRTVYWEFTNTAAYSPLPYFPQTLAILIARPLGFTVLEILYFARLVNLLFYIAAGCVALHLTRALVRPIFLLLLMPMSMYLAASMSADVVVNSLAILFCALVWGYGFETDRVKKLTPAQIAVLIFLSAAIGISKFIYLPITALPLLIPTTAFASRNQKRFAITAILAAGFLAAALWSSTTPGLDMIANGNSEQFSPRMQLTYLQQNPRAWFDLPLRTIRDHWAGIPNSFVGCFGWADTPISPIVSTVYVSALVLSCLPNGGFEKNKPSWPTIALLIAIITASSFLLGLTAYLYWNPLGAPFVEGLQGRYFIAIAPPILIFLSIVGRKWTSASLLRGSPYALNIASILIVVGTLAYAFCAIYMRFHGKAA